MLADGLAIPLSLLTIPEVPSWVLTPLQLFTRGQEQGMEVTWEGKQMTAICLSYMSQSELAC